MTKQELMSRVAQLEQQLPVAKPSMPVSVKAHEAGAALRHHVIDATVAAKKGAVVTASVTRGFFAGLFGK